MTTVRLEGVGKSFPGVRALHDVSVEFVGGSIHALVGENGAGKSTLIKILAGAQRPDTGSIVIDGSEVRLSTPHDSTAHGLAFIHQEPNLVEDLSAAENVFLGTPDGLRGGWLVDRSTMHRRYRELVAPLGLEVSPTADVRELGVADQTLIAIARALHRQANLLVFDEPTAALSDLESERLFAIIDDLAAGGRSIVYVSHRLHEIFRLSDTVSVLKDGELVTTRPTTSIDGRDELVSLILGRSMAVRDAREAEASPRRAGMGEVRLRARGIGDGSRVKGASLELRAGEITGLAGLVGAGRSELAAMLCGAASPTSGELEVDGTVVTFRSPRDAARAGVALVPEDRRNLGAIRGLSVRENLTMPFVNRFVLSRAVRLINGRREQRWSATALTELDVRTAGTEKEIELLSGGNQQKVIISRWVGAGAKIFVFDEPTQGVDVGARAEIYAVIRRLADDGAAVLFISSELEEVVAQTDHLYVMREGEIVAHLDDATEQQVLGHCYGHALT